MSDTLTLRALGLRAVRGLDGVSQLALTLGAETLALITPGSSGDFTVLRDGQSVTLSPPPVVVDPPDEPEPPAPTVYELAVGIGSCCKPAGVNAPILDVWDREAKEAWVLGDLHYRDGTGLPGLQEATREGTKLGKLAREGRIIHFYDDHDSTSKFAYDGVVSTSGITMPQVCTLTRNFWAQYVPGRPYVFPGDTDPMDTLKVYPELPMVDFYGLDRRTKRKHQVTAFSPEQKAAFEARLKFCRANGRYMVIMVGGPLIFAEFYAADRAWLGDAIKAADMIGAELIACGDAHSWQFDDGRHVLIGSKLDVPVPLCSVGGIYSDGPSYKGTNAWSHGKGTAVWNGGNSTGGLFRFKHVGGSGKMGVDVEARGGATGAVLKTMTLTLSHQGWTPAPGGTGPIPPTTDQPADPDPEPEPSTLPLVTALASDSIVDRLGITLHLGFRSDARWAGMAWLDRFRALGLRNVRTNLGTSDEAKADFLKLGVRGLFNVGNQPREQIEHIRDLIDAGQAIGVEGDNEANVETNGVPNDPNWVANTRAKQAEIAAHVPPGVLVLAPSLWLRQGYEDLGPVPADCANLHQYNGGKMPSVGLTETLAATQIVAPGKPIWTTEHGQRVADGGPTSAQVLPADLGAVYMLRGMLLHLKRGVERVFHYGLLDKNADTHHGLLRDDLTPRPMYTALRNLIATLADPGPAFPLAPLRMALEGDLTGVETLLLQRRNGTYTLALWREAEVWNTRTAQPVPVAPRALTLKLAAPRTVQTYDPHTGALGVRAVSAVSHALTVGGSVLLLDIA